MNDRYAEIALCGVIGWRIGDVACGIAARCPGFVESVGHNRIRLTASRYNFVSVPLTKGI